MARLIHAHPDLRITKAASGGCLSPISADLVGGDGRMLCSCSVFPYGTFCGTEYHHAGEKDAPGEANNNLEISKSKVFKNGKEMQHIFCKMMLISPVFVVVVWFHVCIRWSTYTI